jgi:polar amino acid transport system substrate-binding protein
MLKHLAICVVFVTILLTACAPAVITPPPAPQPTETQKPSGPPGIIAVDSGNPPFMYEVDGKAAGLYPLLLKEVFARLNIPMEVRAYPWKRALGMGEAGQAGVGGIYKNEKRLEFYDYSDPIYTENLMLYAKKGGGFEFKTIDDLKGKQVGIILGWSYGDAFDKAKEAGLFQVQEVTTDSANLEKLLQGKVDCVVAIDLAADPIIQKMKYQDQIEKLPTPIAVNDTFLVFAKTIQQKDLLDKFNQTLKAMKQDGTYEALINEFQNSQ